MSIMANSRGPTSLISPFPQIELEDELSSVLWLLLSLVILGYFSNISVKWG